MTTTTATQEFHLATMSAVERVGHIAKTVEAIEAYLEKTIGYLPLSDQVWAEKYLDDLQRIFAEFEEDFLTILDFEDQVSALDDLDDDLGDEVEDLERQVEDLEKSNQNLKNCLKAVLEFVSSENVSLPIPVATLLWRHDIEL